MPLVATLIAAPGRSAFRLPDAEAIADAAGTGAPDWLCQGEAFDLDCPAGWSAGAAERRLRDALNGRPADLVVQPRETRRKRLLLADMDSTMIDQECIDELAAEAGLKDRVAAITARAMNGEIAFEPALRARVALLAGLNEAVIERVIESRITVAAGAKTLVRTMNAAGCRSVLVSGGFTAFTKPIAAAIGFHRQVANVLLVAEGKLTGEVAEPILGREAKADTLRAEAEAIGIAPADAIAVGDGANDLAMLALAGVGVAMHAKPVVAAQARFRIDHADLTALLYMQGYRRAEFVA